jgi:hypothetical protein
LIWETPSEISDAVIDVARHLNGEWVGLIQVDPELWTMEFCCHWNVQNKVNADGGKMISGWYLLFWEQLDIWQAVWHSVYQSSSGQLVDITPHPSGLDYHMFVKTSKCPTISNLYYRKPFVYRHLENSVGYCVYMLVNPCDNKPLCVDKVKGNRSDLFACCSNHRVEYVAENIPYEYLADEMIEQLVRIKTI